MSANPHLNGAIEIALHRLETVLQSRDRIARSISDVANELPRHRRSFASRLSRRFRMSITPQRALTDFSALTICLPLMQQAEPNGKPLTDWQINLAVRDALLVPSMPVPPSRRLTNALAYPLVMLFGCAMLILGYCWFLVPQFDEMFEEFGLRLPAATRGLVAFSHLVRSTIFLPSVVICIGIAITMAFAIRWRQKGGFLDGILTNSRIACGTWAWHVSLLLELGFSQADAIATAGRGSCKGWLQNASARWAQAARDGRPPLADTVHAHHRSLHLVSLAFGLPDAEDQSALLKETALMYWERGSTVSRWRWGWLAPLVNFVVMCLIGFMVAALFTPLIQLISGL